MHEDRKMSEESNQHIRKIYVHHITYKTPEGFDPVFRKEGQRGILNGGPVEIYFQLPYVMHRHGSTFTDDEHVPGFPFITQGSTEDIEWIVDANKICWRRSNGSGENW